MLIDCDTCEVRGLACRDCVVTFVTIPVRPSAARPVSVVSHDAVHLDAAQHAAIDALAAGGLVPPLRHRSDQGEHTAAS